MFFHYFGAVVRSDRVDFWTPLLTRNFKAWLLDKEPDPPRRHPAAYAPTSVNRMLATLRHFAKYIQAHRECPFVGGYPLEDVKDIKLELPEWNGLEKLELTRLQAAVDQLAQISSRANQSPRRSGSLFTLSLAIGLRASEIESLNLDQYHDNYLHKVLCKGP